MSPLFLKFALLEIYQFHWTFQRKSFLFFIDFLFSIGFFSNFSFLLLTLDLICSPFSNFLRCPFHYRGLECKSRKSRNTWGNRQIWPQNMEWSRARASKVLPREHTGRSKHPLPTTQEKTLHMDITRWSTSIKIRLIIFFAAKDGEALYSQQKQDQELTVAHIMSSLLPNSDLNWRK